MASLNFIGRNNSIGGTQQAASGDTLTLVSGATIDLTSATTKLPLQFYINNVQLSANFTATNANTLVNGGNADALHTHTGVSATAIDLPGQTVWGSPVAGEIGYINSTDNTWSKAQANAVSTAGAAGCYSGTSNTLYIGGAFLVFLDSGLNGGTAPASGQKIYLSAATAGRATNVAPNTTGQVEVELGWLLVATGYNNTSGSAQKCVWQPKAMIPL